MSQHKSAEVSEAEIAVHWQEEAQIHPSKKFVAQANLVDQGSSTVSASTAFQTTSRSTPISSTGTSAGTSCLTRAIRRSGDGLSVAGSTPVIIASIVI